MRAGDVEALPRRQAEERVRHLIVQRGSEREMPGSSWLMFRLRVGGPAETEVTAGRARVLEADRHVAGELARDVDRVLVHLRRGSVLIDEVDLLPTLVSAPRVLPIGCSKPLGYGLVKSTVGRNCPCWISVSWLNPTWP